MPISPLGSLIACLVFTIVDFERFGSGVLKDERERERERDGKSKNDKVGLKENE